MTATPASTPALRATTLGAVACLSLLAATGAQAQSAGCEQFRNTLAAKVDPGIKGFTIDFVRADAPIPAGGKVWGNCDGGAYKLVFRRGGNTRPDTGGASAPAAASAAAPAPKPAPVVAAPPPAPVPAPTPAPAPVVKVAEAPTPTPPPAPAPVVREPEKVAVAEPAPAPVAAKAEDKPAPAEASSTESGSSPWQWLWALVLVPLVAWLWAWVAHRRAYDEAGLPRGPKIRI